jgi:hypothetical protein
MNQAADAASQAGHSAVDSAAGAVTKELGDTAGSLAAPAIDAATGSGHEAVDKTVDDVKKKGSSG